MRSRLQSIDEESGLMERTSPSAPRRSSSFEAYRRAQLIESVDWSHPYRANKSQPVEHLTRPSMRSAEMDSNHQTTTTTTAAAATRRRNSTYLALACANAVSQGAMTRSLRQMFESAPAQQAQPALLSRDEIKRAIAAAKLRRNSIAFQPDFGGAGRPDPSAPFSTTVMAVPAIVVPAPSPSPPTPPPKPGAAHLKELKEFKEFKELKELKERQQQESCFRCDKCSSILASPPQSPLVPSSAGQLDAEARSGAKLAVVPTNREVNEDELPKPDTVKNARCLFESGAPGEFGAFATLQHVKSNPSSRIVRSESTMTLDRAASGAPCARFRWPSNQLARSPSPSPAPSPLPTAPFGVSPGKSQKTPPVVSYYRSTPSLTQYGGASNNQRASRFQQQQHDAESCVSEAGSDCWSGSDLDSEASCFSASTSSGRDSSADPLSCPSSSMDGTRYISPQVMDKIRSYGMTLTFVNGKMVDEDELDEALAKQNERNTATAPHSQVSQKPIHSAGQSRSSTNSLINKSQFINNNNNSVKMASSDKRRSPQPRIVACLPKPVDGVQQKRRPTPDAVLAHHYSATKVRHSSGESSASSGVSSGDNASEHSSPFATLKRTKSSEAERAAERSPSPGPRQSGATKSLGSSPFGCYSVVYSFDASAQQQQQQHQQQRRARPMYV